MYTNSSMPEMIDDKRTDYDQLTVGVAKTSLSTKPTNSHQQSWLRLLYSCRDNKTPRQLPLHWLGHHITHVTNKNDKLPYTFLKDKHAKSVHSCYHVFSTWPISWPCKPSRQLCTTCFAPQHNTWHTCTHSHTFICDQRRPLGPRCANNDQPTINVVALFQRTYPYGTSFPVHKLKMGRYFELKALTMQWQSAVCLLSGKAQCSCTLQPYWVLDNDPNQRPDIIGTTPHQQQTTQDKEHSLRSSSQE